MTIMQLSLGLQYTYSTFSRVAVYLHHFLSPTGLFYYEDLTNVVFI